MKYRSDYYTSVDENIRPMVVKAVKLAESVNNFVVETCGQSIMRDGDLTTGDYFKMIGDSISLLDEMNDFLISYAEWENRQLDDVTSRLMRCEDQNKEILSKLDTLLERRKD